MPVVNCNQAGCDFTTGDVDTAIAAAFITHHLASVHPPSATPKAPAIDMPKIKSGIMEDAWNVFSREWTIYKKAANVPNDNKSVYLLNCCDSDLKANLHKEDPDISTKDEATVLAAVKRLAVVSVATCVLQTELMSLHQDHQEPVRHFVARAWGKARNCGLSKKCPKCTTTVDYSDNIVKMVLLNGMSDEEIKREVLGTENLDTIDLNTTIGLIETKECASRSLSESAASHSRQDATSTYKKILANDKRLQAKGKCEKCQEEFKKNSVRSVKGKDDELVTFKYCKPCWKEARKERKSTNKDSSSEASAFGFLSEIAVGNPGEQYDNLSTPVITTIGSGRKRHHAVRMPNFIFDGTNGWQKTVPEAQPTVRVQVSTDRSDYAHLGLRHPVMKPTSTDGVTDTGAQCNLLGLSSFHRMGLKKSCLVPVSTPMRAVNGEGINILGAVFLRISAKDEKSGVVVNTAVMAYVSDSTDRFYLSRQCMRELGIISKDFPSVSANASMEVQQSAIPVQIDGKAACGCPTHSAPPPRPTALPFERSPDNIGKMKDWLLTRFASSTFNKCPHQPLPMMDCEPIRIHVDPDAKPVAIHQPTKDQLSGT